MYLAFLLWLDYGFSIGDYCPHYQYNTPVSFRFEKSRQYKNSPNSPFKKSCDPRTHDFRKWTGEVSVPKVQCSQCTDAIVSESLETALGPQHRHR